MRWLLVLLLLGVGASAQTVAPGLTLDAARYEPGQTMTLTAVFPDGARGEALLDIGDGRTQTLQSQVQEVDVIVPAPSSRGKYEAALVVDTQDKESTYTATYRVGDQKAPSSVLWLLGGLATALFVRQTELAGSQVKKR